MEDHTSIRAEIRLSRVKRVAVILLCTTALTCVGYAQDARDSDQQATPSNTATTAPTPLPTPSITGPLQAAPPISFEGGSFGRLYLDGVVSGVGLWQSNPLSSDKSTQASLSNGQIFLQKTKSWWQFYLQAGAYDIVSVGTPFISAQKAVSDLYGPLPVAYLKLVPAKNTSLLVGSLPTLMGAEYTFDFQNMNIERGLLWNQENAINRGIQLNQTLGKLSLAFSWNDGYYSNRYSWLSGSLTYVNGPHSLSFVGMGNLDQTAYQTFATPVQNNGLMYAAIYTYTKGSWIVQPYFQYSDVPTNRSVGVLYGASTWGGAILTSHTFKQGFSLAGRGEYITTTGSVAQQSLNLLYGPCSGAWSLTLTPTYQYQRFFARADLAWVQATSFTPGSAFGSAGTSANQPRGVLELGFLF
jgi:putative OmpL-like beta-barrel porin-2